MSGLEDVRLCAYLLWVLRTSGLFSLATRDGYMTKGSSVSTLRYWLLDTLINLLKQFMFLPKFDFPPFSLIFFYLLLFFIWPH